MDVYMYPCTHFSDETQILCLEQSGNAVVTGQPPYGRGRHSVIHYSSEYIYKYVST